ncbi:MAG: hypothetical protein RR808_07995 [Akkermansia sp.]
MTTLQLSINSSNWDETLITATGLTREGLPLSSSVSCVIARDLPAQQFAIWSAIRDQLSTIDPGGKACKFAIADLVEVIDSQAVINEAIYTPAVTHQAVRLTLHWSNVNGTTEVQEMCLDDANVLHLYEYLTDEGVYL